MTIRKTVTALLAAMATLVALVPPAMASPAGSEYLPKVPQSGSHSSASESSQTPAIGGSETTSTTSSGEATGSKKPAQTKKPAQKKERKPDRGAATVSSSKTDGGSSGSPLLSPVTLFIAAAILAMIFWVVLRRMRTRADAPPARPRPGRGEFAGSDNAP